MKNQRQNRIGHALQVVLRGGFLAGCLSLASSAQAGINFEFQYNDAVGVGFLDPIHGVERRAALETAGSTFSNMFGSHFSNSGTIVLEAAAIAKPGTLAEAATFILNPGSPGFNLEEVIRTKLQTGVDLNESKADGTLSVNFDEAWALDYNSPPSSNSGTYDFYSTMNHEFTHALGFVSTISGSGEPLFKSTASWNTFDSLISNLNGEWIIDDTFALNQSRWDSGRVGNVAAGGSDGLFFAGPNAVAANEGTPVMLYTPEEWNEASSVSHLDHRISSLEGLMMAPEAGPGLHARDYDAIEVGILTDIGYAAVVPEPQTYALMLAGLALLGWAARNRKIENLK